MKYINSENLKNLEFDNEPFPHIVIDNFFNNEFIDNILYDMNNLTIDKSYYYGDQRIEKNKFAFNSNFGDTLKDIFVELNSDEFISIIESFTGIKNIIKDNIDLQGAGIHKIYNQGFLCMHSDFEAYHDIKYGLLDRRLNILIYMNPDWKDSYGGELCLFDRNTSRISKKILPILNRAVIFITPNNIHGHPYPVNIPDHICRQSIANYYYTKNTTGKNLDGDNIKLVTWYNNIM
jgi:Rps23 Pro-64 3,4-dihydroxylase Tpa1-like proline 4-hydroxylase